MSQTRSTAARLLLALALLLCTTAALQAQRTVAITIDDLPVVTTRKDYESRLKITKNLLAHIKKAKVPAIGFVNENKLYNGDKRVEQEVQLLKMWLDAGLELGNHTFSHRSLNRIELADYQADVLKGETITRELLEQRGRKLRYFRHPFLQTGRSIEVKTSFADFLTQRSYTIAPITFENADYIFSRAYDIAFDRGDKKLMAAVGKEYVPYMQRKLEYWERQSVRLFNREVPQTLLIHANFINSDYCFVTLETALTDEAYRLPDTYTGPAGISWLHRWARDRGKDFIVPDEPKVPDFVLKLSGFESE
jgi:peptidoglycan/xylan/chitin deacetylase (PgdA/CDA1 family)